MTETGDEAKTCAEFQMPTMESFLNKHRLKSLADKFAAEQIQVEDLIQLQKAYLDEFMGDLGLKGLQKSKLTNALKELKAAYQAAKSEKKGGDGNGDDLGGADLSGDDMDDDAGSEVVHVVVSPHERELLSEIEAKQKEVTESIAKYDGASESLDKMSVVENKKLDESFEAVIKLLNERKESYLKELQEAFVKKEAAIKVELEKSEKYDKLFQNAKKEYNRMVKDSGVSLVRRELFLKERVDELVDGSTLIATEAKVTFDWNKDANESWVKDGIANVNTFERPVFAPLVDMSEILPTSFVVTLTPSKSDLTRDQSENLKVSKFKLRMIQTGQDPRESFDASGAGGNVGGGSAGDTTTITERAVDPDRPPLKLPGSGTGDSAGDDEKKSEEDDEEKKEDGSDEKKADGDGEQKEYDVDREEAAQHKVEGLPWGTEYSVESCSYNSYGYGPWSKVQTVKTLMPVVHIVSRGGHSGSWSYGATPFAKDACTVTPTHDVCLVGTGVWVGSGSTKFKMNVYRGPNSSGATPIYKGDELTYVRSAKNTTPIMYPLRGEGIELKAATLYTIENLQKGPSSHKTSSTSAATVTQAGIGFAFGTASQSPNGTLGQMPCLYFYKIGTSD